MAQLSALAHHIFYSQISTKPEINLSDACANNLLLSDYISQEEFNDFFSKQVMSYADIQGDLGLRTTILNNLYEDFNLEDISTFSGAQEAIFATYLALLDKGDEVVVITPCYQSLNHYVNDLNINFINFQLNFENDWKLDFEGLEKAISNKTKMLVINYPNNPTGAHLNKNEVIKLANIASKYGLYVLSDEVSAFSTIDAGDRWCFSNYYDKAISISVMSKSFGAPGVRIGWSLCKDQEINRRLKRSKTYLSICTSRTDEFICNKLIKKSKEILNKNNNIIFDNVARLNKKIPKNLWNVHNAGIVTTVKTKKEINLIIEDLLKQDILILPTSVFGYEGNYFRLGLGNLKAIDCFIDNLEHFFN